MTQRVPHVGRTDVERVVRRDFAAPRQPDALEILREYRSDSPHRVHLAALKLANGDLDQLRDWIARANVDFRDVLAGAEYPLAFARASDIDALSESQRRELYDADWGQYQRWLQRT